MCIGISRTLEVWLHHGDLNRVRGYNTGTHRLTFGFMKFALTESFLISLFEKFEDTKWLIRSRKSKRSLSNRQHNDQKKKIQTTIYKTLHRKIKIEQHKPH